MSNLEANIINRRLAIHNASVGKRAVIDDDHPRFPGRAVKAIYTARCQCIGDDGALRVAVEFPNHTRISLHPKHLNYAGVAREE
jgi:hypothetical protein